MTYPRAITKHIDAPDLDKRIEINVDMQPDPWDRPQVLRLELVHHHPGRTLRVFLVCSLIDWLALIVSSVLGR